MLDFPFRENCEHYEVELRPGKYKFEAWGASGGGNENAKGLGGYTSGNIYIYHITTLLVYVGGKGENASHEVRMHKGGCNGGGFGGAPDELKLEDEIENHYGSGSGGGGATDFRLNTSISSRILVAGGGGGACSMGFVEGAHGGGIQAGNSYKKWDTKIMIAYGANQTYGTEDGIGQNGRNGTRFSQGAEGNGGCGGGYRGGTTHYENGLDTNTGGSGGSSYISGHEKCEPFPNYAFYDIKIQRGDENFSSPSSIMGKGNSGDGHARITFLGKVTTEKYHPIQLSYMFVLISLYYKP